MNKQEKIDRRLFDKMSKKEQAEFDQELKKDADLAESFELNQDLADFFKNEDSDLEDKLDGLGNKYFSNNAPKKTKRTWLWFIPLALLSGIILFYFNSKDTDASPDTIKIENSPSPTLPEVKKIEIDRTVIPEKEKKQESIEKEEEPAFYPPEKEEKSAPIAALNPADFAINPTLEGLLNENVRASNITKLDSPQNEDILKVSSNLFILKGTTDAKPPYQLSIYSNRAFDFDNDYPILRREVSGEKVEEGFIFDFNAKTAFPPGLYYLLLQDEDADLMSISKFRVE